MCLTLLGQTGCASKGYVEERVTVLQTQVESNKTEITRLNEQNVEQDERLNQLSDMVQEALSRAEEAGKLAKGKLVYEVNLTEDPAHFAFDKSALSQEAMAQLDALAERLKSENRNVYLEVQGHTDSIGSEAYNLKLGAARAETVRDYLYVKTGIALHRLNTFSYGESKPVAGNDTPSNRAKNRRVTVVVME
jgi:outer membrane protein OmpA-like peptidoglycan-associated protein